MLAPFLRSFFRPINTPNIYPFIKPFPKQCTYSISTFPIFNQHLPLTKSYYSTHNKSFVTPVEKWELMIKNIELKPSNEDIVNLLEYVFSQKDTTLWNNIINNVGFSTLVNSLDFKTYVKEHDYALFLILEHIYYIKDMLSVKNSRGYIWYSYYKAHVPYFFLFTARYEHWDEFNDIVTQYLEKSESFSNQIFANYFLTHITVKYMYKYIIKHNRIHELSKLLTIFSDEEFYTRQNNIYMMCQNITSGTYNDIWRLILNYSENHMVCLLNIYSTLDIKIAKKLMPTLHDIIKDNETHMSVLNFYIKDNNELSNLVKGNI